MRRRRRDIILFTGTMRAPLTSCVLLLYTHNIIREYTAVTRCLVIYKDIISKNAAVVNDIYNNFDHHHRNPLKDSGSRSSSFGASERRFLKSSQRGKSIYFIKSNSRESSAKPSWVVVESNPSVSTEHLTANPSEKKKY